MANMPVCPILNSDRCCMWDKTCPGSPDTFVIAQAEAMTSHYRLPVLLIEFDHDKAFALQVCTAASLA